jgi:hypothetical protein
MVAMSILATALVALLSLHGSNIQVVAADRRLVRATLLAQDTLTRVLLDEPFPELGERTGAFENDPDYRWQVQVQPGPTAELEEWVRQVRVRVYWDEADSNAVVLVTHAQRLDK